MNTFLTILFFGISYLSSPEEQVPSQGVPSFSDQKVDSIYTSNAVRLLWKDRLVAGDISGKELKTTTATFSAEAFRNYRYEIGTAIYDDESYKYLRITLPQNKVKVELELLARAEVTAMVPQAVEERRKDWISLCNQHNAKGLVEELYWPDAAYYNHRPLIRDQQMLIREYSYMNNPAYTLKLVPLHIEPVNEHLIYEIGQCEGSYPGKYILVWEKRGEEWKIILDSNI